MNMKEHYALILKRGSIYIGHKFYHSISTQTNISHLSEIFISLEKLEVVGCDGTVTSTEWKNGVVYSI